jgi:hypothetical protein
MYGYPAWVVYLAVLGPIVVVLAIWTLWVIDSSRANRAVVKDLMEKGEVTEAEIIGYTQDELIWVQYKFTPKRGEPISCNKALLRGGKRLPIGTKVSVRYMATHPTISVLEPYASSQNAS